MREIMKNAWRIAREGQSEFGGKISEYLSEALKMAWAQVNNKVVNVSWKNERGIEIEMTVEHIIERVIGYSEFFEEDITKKVDEMKVTKLVIGGEEVDTWNTSRNATKDKIETGQVKFRGGNANIEIALPTEINKKVWGEYDNRKAKRKEVANQMEERENHMNKVYEMLECGA